MGRLILCGIVMACLLTVSSIANAQIPISSAPPEIEVFTQETTEIIINANLLLAGERLQYQVFNITDAGPPSSLSKLIYVALHDQQDSVIFQHKLALQDGTAHGFFFLPTSLRTGVYKLLSYTNFSLNKVDKAVTQKDIYIINSFVKLDQNAEKEDAILCLPLPTTEVQTLEVVESDTFGISVKTDKRSYKLREKITLTLKNFTENMAAGNYNLAVRRVDPIQLVDSQGVPRNIDVAPTDVYYLPELRGEIISGTVFFKDTERPAAKKDVAFSIPDGEYIFKIAQTNEYGQFFISIDEPYIAAQAIIQVMGSDRDQFKLSLDDKKLAHQSGEKAAVLYLDPGIKTWLQERSIQLQIENAYFDDEKVLLNPQKSAAPFYGTLGDHYMLDDYSRFPTLKETFVEIIRWARVRKKEGKEVLEVLDPHNPYNVGPYSDLDPLVLVDGISMQRASEVLGISAHDVKSIRVIPEPYRYGPKLFRGIIDIKTKQGGFRPEITGAHMQQFDLESPVPSRRYASPDYADHGQQRIPDYRVQLHWQPNIRLKNDAHTEQFYASDVPGTYQIVLAGYSLVGKQIKIIEYFKVE